MEPAEGLEYVHEAWVAGSGEDAEAVRNAGNSGVDVEPEARGMISAQTEMRYTPACGSEEALDGGWVGEMDEVEIECLELDERLPYGGMEKLINKFGTRRGGQLEGKVLY